MSLKVGELVAFIRADGAQFDRAVDSAGSKFSGLGDKISAGTKAIAGSMTAVGTAALGIGAAVLKIGLDYNKLQQSSRAALTTLLGSATAANAQMDKLDAFARQSPFAKQVFITAQQQLLGFGVAAEKVLPTLDAIQNAVAATGGSNEQIAGLTEIFAKIQSSAKITAEDLNQFGNYGIDAAGLIGAAMGKTGSDIRTAISKGTIGATDALDALTSAMMARFGGATANIKQQFSGAVDRIKGAWRDIGSVLATPFIDPHGGGMAVEWANKVADALRALQAKAEPLVALLVQRFKPALESVTPALDKVRGLINSWDLSKVNGQLDTLAKYAPLIAPVGAALAAVGGASLPVLGRFLPALNPVVAAIGALVATSPDLQRVAKEFFTALSPLEPQARLLGRQFTTTALSVVRDLAPALEKILTAATPLILTLGDGLANGLSTAMKAAEPLARALGDVAGVIRDMPQWVIFAATAWVTLNGPLQQVAKTVGSELGPVLKTARESWTASQAVAQALGRDVGAVGTAAIAARAGVVGLGAALKGALISSGIGIAIVAITTALGAFMAKQSEARQRAEDFAQTLDQATGAITKNTRALVVQRLEEDGAIEAYQRMGGHADDLVDKILEVGGAAERVGRVLHSQDTAQTGVGGQTWQAMSHDAHTVQNAIGGVSTELENGRDKQMRMAAAMGDGARATDQSRDSFEQHASAVERDNDATREAANNALTLKDAQLASADAQDRLADAVQHANEVDADEKSTIRDKQQAHRQVEQALLDVARSYGTQTDAMVRNNASAKDLDATIQQQRDAFIAQAEQIGKTAAEAAALADQYGLIPDRVYTKAILDAADAQKAIDYFITSNTGRQIKVHVTPDGHVNYKITGTGLQFNANGALYNGRHKAFDDGGVNAAGQYVPRAPQIVQGGADIRWGEPETGWEAYISGKPSQRSRNLAVLDEAARRLGVAVAPLANGGVRGADMGPSAPAVVNRNITITVDARGRPDADQIGDAILARLQVAGVR